MILAEDLLVLGVGKFEIATQLGGSGGTVTTTMRTCV
jgi:DNA-binding CsgD family transcriptional regulator